MTYGAPVWCELAFGAEILSVLQTFREQDWQYLKFQASDQYNIGDMQKYEVSKRQLWEFIRIFKIF